MKGRPKILDEEERNRRYIESRERTVAKIKTRKRINTFISKFKSEDLETKKIIFKNLQDIMENIS